MVFDVSYVVKDLVVEVETVSLINIDFQKVVVQNADLDKEI